MVYGRMPTAEQQGSFRFNELPTFDDISGLKLESPATERASHRLHEWSENREEVVRRLFEISDELDSMKRRCDISTVVGSSVGIGGGAAIIAGLICAPPVAIGGLVVSGAAAAANLTTGVVKVAIIKKRAKEVMELVHKDEVLFKAYSTHATEMKQHLIDHEERSEEDAAAGEEGEEGGKTRADVSAMGRHLAAATAAGVSAAGARAALMQTTRLAPAVMKGIAHGAAGVGIVLDTLSLILSSRDLAKGESLEYAEKLRAMAGEMKAELYDETAVFIGMILPE